MHDKRYKIIASDAEFISLQRQRSTFSWLLTTIVLVAYYLFILVVAFYPEFLATPLNPATVITWCIPFGIFLIILSMVTTCFYVWRVNNYFDLRMRYIKERLTE